MSFGRYSKSAASGITYLSAIPPGFQFNKQSLPPPTFFIGIPNRFTAFNYTFRLRVAISNMKAVTSNE